MSPRLFTPPGPQVTPAEARARRAEHHAAQEALPLADRRPLEHAPACPACGGGTFPDHDCPAEALTLETDR